MPNEAFLGKSIWSRVFPKNVLFDLWRPLYPLSRKRAPRNDRSHLSSVEPKRFFLGMCAVTLSTAEALTEISVAKTCFLVRFYAN